MRWEQCTSLMLAVRSPELAEELLASMDALHGSCRLAAPGGDVVPGGLDIPPPSWAERALWTGLGLLLQPVRVLV